MNGFPKNPYFVDSLQVVAPKKAKLAAATAEFEELQAALSLKKAILREVEEKLAGLQDQLRKKGEEKAALEADILNCQNVMLAPTMENWNMGRETGVWSCSFKSDKGQMMPVDSQLFKLKVCSK